jgi:hypothetical protein
LRLEACSLGLEACGLRLEALHTHSEFHHPELPSIPLPLKREHRKIPNILGTIFHSWTLGFGYHPGVSQFKPLRE